MDSRCPRKLKDYPDEWCPLAVLRLKLIRNAGRELTEEEEMKLRGCNWACNCQSADYCFFKYSAKYLEDSPISDIEIAHMLNISVDTLKKIEAEALLKVRDSDFVQDLEDNFGPDNIIDGTSNEEEHNVGF